MEAYIESVCKGKKYNSNKFEIHFFKFKEISKLFLADDPTLLYQWSQWCGHRGQLIVTVVFLVVVVLCICLNLYCLFKSSLCLLQWQCVCVFETTVMLKKERKERIIIIFQSNSHTEYTFCLFVCLFYSLLAKLIFDRLWYKWIHVSKLFF